jgi:hypothetical protein
LFDIVTLSLQKGGPSMIARESFRFPGRGSLGEGVSLATAAHHRASVSGEHRLPACSSWQLATKTTTYSVWDGWDLVEEYRMPGPAVQARYLHGPSGLVKNLVTNNYYYQDGSGSTSHLAGSTGALLEWYRYDLQGTPIFYNAANVQISGSNQGVRQKRPKGVSPHY